MPDWYRTHNASPDAYSDEEYRDWAQDNGLYVDAAGNVDYGSRYADCYEVVDTLNTFDPGPGYVGNTSTCQPGLCSCWNDDGEDDDG